MECIAVINQKGGVGKTTTAVNAGVGLAKRGRRVLLIDLDPQGHLTTHLGLDQRADGSGAYELLTQDQPLDEAVLAHAEGFWVSPARIDLAAAEVELVSVVGREVILRDALSRAADRFDLVVIDCPPSLGVLTLNALAAATHVLVPLQPHFLALQGVGKLFETIHLVASRINPRLKVLGVVLCMFEAGTRLASEVIEDLDRFLAGARSGDVPWRDADIFQTRIRRNVKLAECPSHGASIFEYAPRSHGAADYLQLADELLAHLEGRAFTASTEPSPPPEARMKLVTPADPGSPPLAERVRPSAEPRAV